MRPISEIVHKLGIPEQFIEPYGTQMAKLRLELLQAKLPPTKRKLILVTAMTSTSSGEGKTVTSIGLAQGLERIGLKSIVTLRQPSLGPVFGLKGGATGGGKSSVVPSERINLHFTGDFHAITSAHNLIAAVLDAHLHHGNALRFDMRNVLWPRCMDMNDRALRRIAVGLGGNANGPARETGFVITAASEIMAILALSKSPADLRERLDEVVLGFNEDGGQVKLGQLGITGSLMVLLRDALLPNLVQTTEGTPAIVHAGPFANIAHGTSSVLAQQMGLALADYVVNETGFASDLGAEKYFDIVMPSCGLKPSVAVVIASVRSVVRHGGTADHPMEAGFENLRKHVTNLRGFGVPVVVAINRFVADRSEDIAALRSYCNDIKVASAVSEGFDKGGEGCAELAELVANCADRAETDRVQSLYTAEMSLEDKIRTVATKIYGAQDVVFEANATKQLAKFTQLGYGKLPVCMAKTQASITDDPKLLGAPTRFTVKVRDAALSAGAGFVVALLGEMMLMPGLNKVPQATKLDLAPDGTITGM